MIISDAPDCISKERINVPQETRWLVRVPWIPALRSLPGQLFCSFTRQKIFSPKRQNLRDPVGVSGPTFSSREGSAPRPSGLKSRVHSSGMALLFFTPLITFIYLFYKFIRKFLFLCWLMGPWTDHHHLQTRNGRRN